MIENCWPVLLAEGENAPGGLLTSPMITLFLPLLILFFFMIIRPQQRERAKRDTMLAGLKKNDRVVTAGGIYGVVLNVHREADEVTLRVDESTNTKIRVTLGSISRVLGDEPAATPPAKST